MTKKHRTKKPNLILAGIFILILIILLALSPQFLHQLGLVVPGWEIYDQVGAIRHNDEIYSEASQFTTPKELMGVYWKVDIDDPNFQVPTIYVALSDIMHVDFMGKPIPNDVPAGSKTVTRGNITYYLDYHIYLYTITIRTIADKLYYNKETPIGTIPAWKHETSWPNEWAVWPIGGGDGDGIGQEFAGGVYTKFVISPWRGDTYRTPPNSSYVLYNCWAGVMNTYVFKRQLGQVENQWKEMKDPDTDAPLYIGAGLDEGNQVPMFEDDGTFGTPAPTINWDPSITPDVRIKSTVVQYLPIEMFPGACLTKDALGGVLGLSPCDVAVMYTLRVDVLQSHEFILETAISPPKPTWPSDYFSWAEDFWVALLGGLNPFAIFGPFAPFFAFIFLLMVIGAIIVALLAIFAPWVLKRLTGGLGAAKTSWEKSRKKSWENSHG
jgi:hypothetical protein